MKKYYYYIENLKDAGIIFAPSLKKAKEKVKEFINILSPRKKIKFVVKEAK